jgi:hypothetical protein
MISSRLHLVFHRHYSSYHTPPKFLPSKYAVVILSSLVEICNPATIRRCAAQPSCCSRSYNSASTAHGNSPSLDHCYTRVPFTLPILSIAREFHHAQMGLASRRLSKLHSNSHPLFMTIKPEQPTSGVPSLPAHNNAHDSPRPQTPHQLINSPPQPPSSAPPGPGR